MEINFTIDKKYCRLKKTIQNIYDITLQELNLPDNIMVNIVFVSEEEILDLNTKYRNVNKVTDVLSFPMLDDISELESEIDAFTGMVEIGDIYINPTRAIQQAGEYGHSLKREFCFLALHGFLHLLGYDHMNSEDEEEMFGLQNKIMTKAKVER